VIPSGRAAATELRASSTACASSDVEHKIRQTPIRSGESKLARFCS